MKAISIKGESLESIIEELKDFISDLNVEPNQMSSIVDDKFDLEILSNLKFEDIETVDQLRDIYNAHKNIIVHIDESSHHGKKRTLEEVDVPEVTESVSGFTESKLFVNMTPAALTGLLVSLFLVIMLIIAINCLYGVKTNDAFSRNNLWVGK